MPLASSCGTWLAVSHMDGFVCGLSKTESGTLPMLGLGDALQFVDSTSQLLGRYVATHCGHVASDAAGDCIGLREAHLPGAWECGV